MAVPMAFITAMRIREHTVEETDLSDYRWKITRDFDYEREAKAVSPSDKSYTSAVGTEGPCNLDPSLKMPYRFRMYAEGDDGEDSLVVYEGYCSEEEFYPLDDFGSPNWGCTTIKYYDKQTRKFEVL